MYKNAFNFKKRKIKKVIVQQFCQNKCLFMLKKAIFFLDCIFIPNANCCKRSEY